MTPDELSQWGRDMGRIGGRTGGAKGVASQIAQGIHSTQTGKVNYSAFIEAAKRGASSASQLKKGIHCSQTNASGFQAMDPEKLRAISVAAGALGQAAAFANGKHNTQQGRSGFQKKGTCPHCNQVKSLAILARCHMDRCKEFKCLASP